MSSSSDQDDNGSEALPNFHDLRARNKQLEADLKKADTYYKSDEMREK